MTESPEKTACFVCDIRINVRQHFGSMTCLACASFFRRTVSLGIQYVCKQENKCPVSHAVRSGCRACRYQACEDAGMKRIQVRGKRDINKVPKYVRESIKQGNDKIVRDYTTSTFETLHGYAAKKEESELEMTGRVEEEEDILTILNVTSEQLMQFYVELNESSCVCLSQISIDSYLKLKRENDRFALEICQNCPGTDLLDRQDITILARYCAFSNLWMDSLWAGTKEKSSEDALISEEGEEVGDDDECSRSLSTFTAHFRQTVGKALSRLKFDSSEYAALKSFCIWKLGIVDFSLSLKIVAQEHYLGMTMALTEYYKTVKRMGQFEIAMRIADLTLLLGPIFSGYREMLKLHETLQERFELEGLQETV